MRFLAAALAMVPLVAPAAECSVRSGPHTAALVELYTSEGCSSCPPADRWLSAFVPAAANGDVVPVAFHVGYWDYIGWKDAFADPRYTQRQRDLAAATGSSYVYTPQVVVGGRDFRAWTSARSLESAFGAIRRKPAAVTIDVSLVVGADRGFTAEVTATPREGIATSDLAIFTVVTQNGLGNQVTAGENRGEKLRHDFVVRDLASHRGLGRATATFKPRPDWAPEKMALAAFVQNVKTGEVLQAVALPACR
jgi:hypothetical protein